LSTRSPAGVANRTLYEQATGGVEEWEAASLGLVTHHGHDLLDAVRLLALVWPPGVHLGGLGAALADWRRLNAEPLQELGEFCAGAIAGFCSLADAAPALDVAEQNARRNRHLKPTLNTTHPRVRNTSKHATHCYTVTVKMASHLVLGRSCGDAKQS